MFVPVGQDADDAEDRYAHHVSITAHAQSEAIDALPSWIVGIEDVLDVIRAAHRALQHGFLADGGEVDDEPWHHDGLAGPHLMKLRRIPDLTPADEESPR